MFPPIFVADTKIISGYNFVAPLRGGEGRTCFHVDFGTFFRAVFFAEHPLVTSYDVNDLSFTK